jgi:hypothetical protein
MKGCLLSKRLSAALDHAGYAVDCAADGERAHVLIRTVRRRADFGCSSVFAGPKTYPPRALAMAVLLDDAIKRG